LTKLAHFEDRKAEDISLGVYFFHHLVVSCLLEIAFFPFKENFKIVSFLVIPDLDYFLAISIHLFRPFQSLGNRSFHLFHFGMPQDMAQTLLSQPNLAALEVL